MGITFPAMRKTIFAGLVLGASAMLAAPQIAAAAPATHEVSGTFTNDCGPGGTAWIELRDSTGTVVDSQNIADGANFTFDGVADGDYTVVPFAPAGCGPTPYPGGAAVTVDDADITGVDVGLVAVHSIWGTVTGCTAGEGNGLNGVTVAVDIDNDDLTYHAETTTADFTEAGQFFFQYLPAVDGYTVTVTPPEGCTVDSPTAAVDLSDDDVDDVTFALEKAQSPLGSLASLDFLGSLGSLTGPLGS